MLEYSYTDQAGNTGTNIRIAHVVNTNAPIVTVVGSDSVTIEFGDDYFESGATRTDIADGSGFIASPTS